MTPRDGPQPRDDAATAYDTPPEAALAAIRDFEGPLLLDLDQTLYLRSSTEDFIDSASPGALAVALMKVLDWIEPWRWTGGEATRDAWRVRMVLLLMPWTARRWRQRVGPLVEQFGNAPLLAVLRTHASRPIVVTRGFGPVVTPLVAAFHLGEAGLVAAQLDRFDDGLRDTLQHAVGVLGEDTVRRALVITDSSDDLALLGACARPLRTAWPGAQRRPALSDIYLPGRDLTRIKRRHSIVRGILEEDLVLWVLGSIGLAALPVLHAVGLLVLLLSFWTIYECGYVDRDPAGTPVSRREPWAWALLSGIVAIQLLRWPAVAAPADLAAWLGVLLATRGWFLLHNRLDQATRVWLYPGLQLARAAAFCALVPVAAIGAMAIGAHVLAKSVGRDRAEAPLALTRLLFFTVLALLLAFTQGLAPLASWTAAALLGWNVFQARTDLRAVVTRARRIDRPPPAAQGPP